MINTWSDRLWGNRFMSDDLFLSYSRRESKEFVARLAAALEARGKDAWVDLEDIPPASQFMEDLKEGIGGSDAFCFVLSPAALASDYCRTELEFAVERNKRMIPIAHRRLVEAPPEPLGSHSWIPQEGLFEDDFDASLDELVAALETDVEWVRGHTRWGQRAASWQQRGQDHGALLRGQELRDAESWLAGQADKKPAPTASHTEFILRSQRGARSRTRKVLAAVATALVISLVLAGVAFWQRSVAIENFREATGVRLVSEAQAMLGDLSPGGEVRAMQQLLVAAALTGAPDRNAIYDAVVGLATLDKVIRTPGSFVFNPTYSPDGTLVATGGGDGDFAVRLWDADTGRPHGDPLEGHEGNVSAVSFSPDGARLVSASAQDGSVRFWDVQTREQLGDPLEVGDSAPYVLFSRDGTRVNVVADRKLQSWDVTTRKPVTLLDGVDKVAFSPARSRLAVADAATIRLFDWGTGQPIGSPQTAHTEDVGDLEFSPDGTRLVSASMDSTLRQWDTGTGEPVGNPLSGHDKEVGSVAYSPDGTLIASAGADNSVRLWDSATGKPVGTPLPGPKGLTQGLAFAPDGNRLAVSGSDGILRIFNVGAARTLTGVAVAFGPNGALATGDRNGTVRLWDPVTHRPLGPLVPGHTAGVFRLLFSPDGQQLISSGEDGTVRFWDPRTGKAVGTPITVGDAAVSALAFSPDSTRIVTGSSKGAVRVWDAMTRRPITAELRDAEGAALAAVLYDDSPNTGALIVTPTGGHLVAWNGESGEKTYHENVGIAFTAAFDGDQTTAGLGTVDGRVVLADLETGELRQLPARGHTDALTAMEFGPHGDRVVTGGRDAAVRLWDADTGETIGRPLTGPADYIVNVAVSRDGESVAAGSFNDEVWVWPAVGDPKDLCAKLTANMSRKQWDEWVSPDIDYITVCPDLPISPD